MCFVSLTASATLGRSYYAILERGPDQIYQSDLQNCQDLAQCQSYRDDTIGAAIAGGVFGGLRGECRVALDELHTSWIILQASSPRELLQALPWH